MYLTTTPSNPPSSTTRFEPPPIKVQRVPDFWITCRACIRASTVEASANSEAEPPSSKRVNLLRGTFSGYRQVRNREQRFWVKPEPRKHYSQLYVPWFSSRSFEVPARPETQQ